MGTIIMKNFNFKAVALALSLTVFGSISANASTSALTFNSEGNAQFGNQIFVTDHAFSDSYTFNVGAGNTGSFSANVSSSFFTLFNEINYGVNVKSFSVASLSGTEVTSTQLFGSYAANADSWTLSGNLAAGAYSLVVAGEAAVLPFGALNTTSYGGKANLTISPVPEAGTSSMMLLGLGLMGFIARRRRAD
jgi:hypothetical protein